MKTKKFIVVFSIVFLFLSLVIVPTTTNGQSVGDLQAQVNSLMAKIAELTKQINELKNINVVKNPASTATGVSIIKPEPTNRRICGILNRNLDLGAKGDDVLGLQEFLYEKNLIATQPTGYFGPITSSGVKKWQESEGITAVGAIGPVSRQRLTVWCGGSDIARFGAEPKRGLAPLAVTFKALVGGYTPYKYAIEFGDGSSPQEVRCGENPNIPDMCGTPAFVNHIYEKDGQYTAVLWQYGANVGTTDQGRTALARVNIHVGTLSCTEEYAPVCGAMPIVCITTPCDPIPTTYSNKCKMNAEGARFLYEGMCRNEYPDPGSDPRCKAWYDGCNSCSRETLTSPAMCTLRACAADQTLKPYCTAWFDKPTGNLPPVVSSFSGPTTLLVNENGTWTIGAKDPEGGTLSYSILWGDEYSYISPTATLLGDSRQFTQTTTFSHTYQNAGLYTVIVVVQDSAGLQTKTTTTVKVGNTPVACTLDYTPVCGRPSGCANTCPPGAYCALYCQQHTPKTYSNKCVMSSENADFLHQGECTATSGSQYY